jgi:hypothetical protein
MLALSKDRELRAQRQRAAELLAEAAIAELTRQLELALFMEAKLVLQHVPGPKARLSKPALRRME